jgi:hypothetical protein
MRILTQRHQSAELICWYDFGGAADPGEIFIRKVDG